MDIIKLIDKSDLNNHDKTGLKVLYKRYEDILKNMPLYTQLHELIHYFKGDHFVRRECSHCYIYNLIADYQVEKFIKEHWSLPETDRKLAYLSDKLHSLKLTGEYRDLLHWDCSKCPFRYNNANTNANINITSIDCKCIKLQYILERLIKQLLPKMYIGIIHRNYMALQTKTKTILPVKRTRNHKLNIIVDTSTSIPLVLVQTVIETVFPFTYKPNINLYGFSDICYKLTEDNIRYKDVTHFRQAYDLTKDDRYNIVISDFKFDDFDMPLPKNYITLHIDEIFMHR